VGGTEGWQLALTSLRDLFGMTDTQQIPVIDPDLPPPDLGPADAGGDFAAEAERLGSVTAQLHTALAEAFGRHPADLADWVRSMESQLERTAHPELDRDAVRDRLRAAATVAEPGPAIRIHGDFHLGQVMRTDAGWFVLDFEGEPARPRAERTALASPLKDVAGMLRSLNYAAAVSRRERHGDDDTGDGETASLAEAWEVRNRQAFLEGYLPAAAAAGIIPDDPVGVLRLLTAFELDKAVYEVAYEMGHRPEWVGIPLSAVRRILEAS
jgi:maltokinase